MSGTLTHLQFASWAQAKLVREAECTAHAINLLPGRVFHALRIESAFREVQRVTIEVHFAPADPMREVVTIASVVTLSPQQGIVHRWNICGRCSPLERSTLEWLVQQIDLWCVHFDSSRQEFILGNRELPGLLGIMSTAISSSWEPAIHVNRS